MFLKKFMITNLAWSVMQVLRDNLVKDQQKFCKFVSLATITNLAGDVYTHKPKPFKAVFVRRQNRLRYSSSKKSWRLIFTECNFFEKCVVFGLRKFFKKLW